MTFQPPTSKPRPGAPCGNKNALKHGFYAAKFNRKEILDLQKSEPSHLEDEINMLRVYIRRVFEKTNRNTTIWEDIEILRALALASTCLDRLVRTVYLVQKLYPPADSLMNVLSDVLKEVTADINLDR